jgi:hypothetical protein
MIMNLIFQIGRFGGLHQKKVTVFFCPQVDRVTKAKTVYGSFAHTCPRIALS